MQQHSMAYGIPMITIIGRLASTGRFMATTRTVMVMGAGCSMEVTVWQGVENVCGGDG